MDPHFCPKAQNQDTFRFHKFFIQFAKYYSDGLMEHKNELVLQE